MGRERLRRAPPPGAGPRRMALQVSRWAGGVTSITLLFLLLCSWELPGATFSGMDLTSGKSALRISGGWREEVYRHVGLDLEVPALGPEIGRAHV